MSRIYEPGYEAFAEAVNDQIEKEYGARAHTEGAFYYDENMIQMFFSHPTRAFGQSSVLSRRFIQDNQELAAKVIGQNIVNAFRNYDNKDA